MNWFRRSLGVALLALIVASTVGCGSGLRERRGQAFRERAIERLSGGGDVGTDACDRFVEELTEGYGSNGPYRREIRTFANDLWDGEPVTVFLPVGANRKAPVVFFSHGYGGSDWRTAYEPLIDHVVSRGYVLVYSPYPTFGADIAERYDILWNGFLSAAERFGHRMDLTWVGFMGHSFGGGATPDMAWRGLVREGWGSEGAFLFPMAPWYSFEMDRSKFGAYPEHMVELVQVYDQDEINDHRMAIDIYRSTQLPTDRKFFSFVQTQTVHGCEIPANHATPGRNPSLRLKQYGIYRTFDALADFAFDGNPAALAVLDGHALADDGTGFQPLVVERSPRPHFGQSKYAFKWKGRQNPRAGGR